MLPAPPGAISPYLSNFQGNGLSFGSNVAPWAAGWSGPDMGYNTPGLPVNSLPSGMTEVSAAYGSGGGSGNTGYGGNDNANSGAFDPVGGGTPSAATLATLNSMRPTSLSGVTVNAYAPLLPPMGSVDAIPAGGASSSVNGVDIGAPDTSLHVSNLAPVHVQAQRLVPTSALDNAWMWANDHPFISGLGESFVGSVTGLSPVIVAANAYEASKHGQNPLSALLPLGNKFPNVFGGLQGGLGGNASSTDATNSLQSLLASQSQPAIGSPSGAGGQPPGSSLITGGPLPDYAGLHALGNFGAAPVGGYWNQQALKMANPAYGPYAGYGGAPQPINYANPYAPSGLATAGY